MGGPKSDYYDCYFSEMPGDIVEFKTTEELIRFFINESYLNDTNYLPCLVPGFWIEK